MLAKESVKRRIESEDGISYTEFSYSLLQAYDFLVLHDRFGCTLQLGRQRSVGQHRRRHRSDPPRAQAPRRMAWSCRFSPPRRARSSARPKAARCGWMRRCTSPYEFYQFWFNTDDRDAVRYLKFFTFLDRARCRGARIGERDGAREAPCAARAGARGHAPRARPDRRSWRRRPRPTSCFAAICRPCRWRSCCRSSATSRRAICPRRKPGGRCTELLAAAGVASSKGEAARLVKGGGITLNGRRDRRREGARAAGARDRRPYLRDSKGQAGQLPGSPRSTVGMHRWPGLLTGCRQGSYDS